ncbi:MAG: signal peptidase I [Candidatus Synoicihabitans palmerolidicus]|nr:signal peptidase I [Candidatus Synoicihabitans palmerolidicus]
MLGPFASNQRKMRKHAANWLELAEKVEDYRRDVLPPAELTELQNNQKSLRQLMSNKTDASKLKLGIEGMEDTLRRTGGAFYPKRSLVEYVEFFLVAAIVILGIRPYFFQPFKIPTNSMWPSYNGMTSEVFATTEDEPGFVGSAFRFVTQLAKAHRIDAPANGEIRIPVIKVGADSSVLKPPNMVKGRKWLVIPTTLREYEIYVNDHAVTIRVPGDFDLERVLLDAYFDGAETFPLPSNVPIGRGVYLPTGKTVSAGERILSFDVLTGDQLFVDRISYHFVKPSVGDGFVFRTKNLTELHRVMRGPKDQYYIKRLVGIPEDVLEIRKPVLYRNGEPIEGSPAFEKNAKREDRYPGYRNLEKFELGDEYQVPADSYLAFGDNSASSLDGRYWGSVPAKDVVGRPLFIYYPFTKHWGRAP